MISVIFSTRSENFKSFGGLGKKFFLTCESLLMSHESWLFFQQNSRNLLTVLISNLRVIIIFNQNFFEGFNHIVIDLPLRLDEIWNMLLEGRSLNNDFLNSVFSIRFEVFLRFHPVHYSFQWENWKAHFLSDNQLQFDTPKKFVIDYIESV